MYSPKASPWKFLFSEEFASRTGILEVSVVSGPEWFRDALGSVIHFAGMDCSQHIEKVTAPSGVKTTLKRAESGEYVLSDPRLQGSQR